MIKVAFQMDELSHINFDTDTTYIFMQEAYRRGLSVYFYSPKAMSWSNGTVIADLKKVIMINNNNSRIKEKNQPIEFDHEGLVDLSTMDFIFLRQDPPFDMAYITSTFFLEKIMHKVQVINNPVSVRNSPEKLLVTEFYEYMPRTLITSSYEVIKNFVNDYKKVVIKPLYGNAGKDVFLVTPDDFNTNAIINYFINSFREQFVVQEFLESVSEGDKRIILIDGEVAGGFNRVPKKGDFRSNLALGATAEKISLSESDYKITKAIGSKLKDLGLFFVGIDVIGDYITEINVTSPTGLRSIMDIGGENLAIKCWDILLKRR